LASNLLEMHGPHGDRTRRTWLRAGGGYVPVPELQVAGDGPRAALLAMQPGRALA